MFPCTHKIKKKYTKTYRIYKYKLDLTRMIFFNINHQKDFQQLK